MGTRPKADVDCVALGAFGWQEGDKHAVIARQDGELMLKYARVSSSRAYERASGVSVVAVRSQHAARAHVTSASSHTSPTTAQPKYFVPAFVVLD